MPEITVNVAVIQGNKILLTKRDDFEVWCLPSGGVEDGESLVQAAIRETKEETGLDVELKSLVGIYSRTGTLPDIHAVLFTAVPVGGKPQVQAGETIEVRYFALNEIPDELSFGHRKRIDDAMLRTGGSVVVTQEMILPAGQEIHAEDILEARKLPRESRRDFYRQLLEQAELRIKMEIGDLPAEKHTPTVFLEIIQQLSNEYGAFDPSRLPEVLNPVDTRKLMTKDFRFWVINTRTSDGDAYTDELCYNTISKQFWVLRTGSAPDVRLFGPGEI